MTEAMAAPVCSKLIFTWFPVQERSKANGVWFIGLNASLVAGMPLVAWLIATLDWHGSFYVVGALNLIPVIACFALVYDTVAEHPRISKEEAAYIMAGRVEEGRADAAAGTSYRFLKKKVFWLTTVVYSVNLAAYWGTMQWLPTYLRANQGISLTRTGWLAAIPYILNIAFLIVFTPLMDKYNARSPVTLAGCLALTACMIIVATTGNQTVALTFISLAFGCITMANLSLFPILQNNLEANEIATSIGFFTGIAYVFSSAFPYIMGFLYSYSGTMTLAFYMLVGTVAVGVLATIPIAKQKL
jgi:sugar phosphate permease